MPSKDGKYCGCLYYASNALARNMTRLAEEEFGITGLSPSHAMLVMAVNDNPGIHAAELAATMQLQPSTVTRLVEKMEEKGILERRSAGKYTEVHPTEKSRGMNMRLHEAWLNLYKRYTAILGEQQANALAAQIYQAAKALDG